MRCCCPMSSSFGRAFLSVAIVGAASLIATGFVQSEDKPAPKEVKCQPYPLATCIVSNMKLTDAPKPVVKQIDGREVRFCCDQCPTKFEEDKAGYFKKIDDQIIAQQLKHYPLTTCVVMTDEELTDPAENVNLVYANRLVRFCCNGCPRKFKADPAKYLAVIDEAVIAQQKEAYPLTTCPISGAKLDSMGGPVTKVYGVTMVKFCCNGCVGKFEADYTASMAKVTDAWKAKHAGGKSADGHDHSDHDHNHDGHDHPH